MIKNKKIILICKETFSYPLYFLGQELSKYNEIHYYFINNSDVLFKTHFNQTSYFYFKKKIKKNRLHDVKDINIKFFKNRKKVKINKKRLKEIESKYSRFSSLNQQIISGQYTSTAYHDRFYYRETTYEENLYWLILNYDKSEKLLNSLNPDYIFDLDSSEIQRTIINEISHHYGIPYINIEYSRYESYLIPTFNLGLRLDKYFI